LDGKIWALKATSKDTSEQRQLTQFQKETRYLDGKIWALKASSLTSPLTVTVTV